MPAAPWRKGVEASADYRGLLYHYGHEEIRVFNSKIRPLSVDPEVLGCCEKASGASRIQVVGGLGAFLVRLCFSS